MLEQLLELKKRREGRLRQKLAAGNQRYEHLCHARMSLVRERKELQQAWLQLGQEGRGRLPRERLHLIKRELEGHFQRDKALEEETNDMDKECQHWLKEKIDIQQKIRRVRIEQEKLEWVLSEGLDAC